jgi:hypothetical protein
MIGHEDEAATKPMIALRAVQQESNEALKRVLVVQHSEAILHAERKQVGNVAVAIRPKPVQPTESAGRWFGGGPE